MLQTPGCTRSFCQLATQQMRHIKPLICTAAIKLLNNVTVPAASSLWAIALLTHAECCATRQTMPHPRQDLSLQGDQHPGHISAACLPVPSMHRCRCSQTTVNGRKCDDRATSVAPSRALRNLCQEGLTPLTPNHSFVAPQTILEGIPVTVLGLSLPTHT